MKHQNIPFVATRTKWSKRPIPSYHTAEAIYVLLKRNYWSVRCARPSDERSARGWGHSGLRFSRDSSWFGLLCSPCQAPSRGLYGTGVGVYLRARSDTVSTGRERRPVESVQPFGCRCNTRLCGRVNEPGAVENIACQIVLEKTWNEFCWN